MPVRRAEGTGQVARLTAATAVGNRRQARRAAAAAKARVQVTVPITTLLGLDDAPAELAGYGPIPAAMAREIAADATWRRLLTDPASGALLDYGATTYRPPASLAGHVQTRDKTCVFPGCIQPADTCDLDHRVPFPHGPTSADNLQPTCRHHHRCKQNPGWTVTRDPNGGHTWTTPPTAPTPTHPSRSPNPSHPNPNPSPHPHPPTPNTTHPPSNPAQPTNPHGQHPPLREPPSRDACGSTPLQTAAPRRPTGNVGRRAA
jgi:Domain of unknown function (DUF222)